MSLADELNAIQKLHENGSLTNEEFAAAKATIIGSPTHLSDPPNAKIVEQSPQLPLPTSKPKSKSKTILKVGSFLAFCGLGGLALAIAIWFVLLMMFGGQTANHSLQTLVKAPIELRDSVESVSASSWRAVGLSLPYSGAMTLSIEVTRGNPIDVFVIDSGAIADLKADRQFNQYSEFHANKAKSFKQTARLSQGVYYVVLRDTTLGILSSSSSDVAVKARISP
jgi:hypothetical protein